MAEDPELERRLDAMFASATPPAGFQEELLARLGRLQPWHRRLARWLAAPAHLAPALAALVLVAGAGWLLTGFHPAGQGTASTAAAPAPAFGVLPAFGPAGKTVDAANAQAAQPPATLPAPPGAGSLSAGGAVPSGSLPVFRFREPTQAELAAAGAALATRSGLPVTATLSAPGAAGEPRFSATGLAIPAGTDDLRAAAQGFLAAHQLVPAYSYRVVLEPQSVVYARLLGPAGIPVVLADGSLDGLRVDFGEGAVTAVGGPLELPLESAEYPLRASTSEAQPRLAPSGEATAVYVLATAGGSGYLEPEQLVPAGAGASFQPLLDPRWLAGGGAP